jgi:hypothetical protein
MAFWFTRWKWGALGVFKQWSFLDSFGVLRMTRNWIINQNSCRFYVINISKIELSNKESSYTLTSKHNPNTIDVLCIKLLLS